MARELAIYLYLFVFKCIFCIFKLFPLRDKITFVVSFGDNSQFVFEEMQRQNIQKQVIFLCQGTSLARFKGYESAISISFGLSHPLSWVNSIYHIATSQTIIIDNYFGFLAVTNFKNDVQCIQLWHASGALKKFGLEDESVKYRSKRAINRFLKVYSKFDKVIVGSDVMAAIFLRSFHLQKENILPTGVPRTDFFYDETAKKKVLETYLTKYPLFKKKKIILYAPTYRDYELDHFSLQLDLDKMNSELREDFILILRFHPAIKDTGHYSEQFPDFVFDFSGEDYDINDLLIISDYLITDYSSIPYDYSLLRRPMLFFTYDLEEYKEKRGITVDIINNLPGPVVKDTETIIEMIKNECIDVSIIDYFTDIWNKYSKGNSSQNLVNYLFKQDQQV